MATKLMHEEAGANGLTIRVETTESAIRATALRGGKVLAVVSQGHGGVHGPATWRPHESPLAKSLGREVEDKALGRVRRGAFDQLVNDLRVARDTRRVMGRNRPALFINKPRPKATKSPLPLIFKHQR